MTIATMGSSDVMRLEGNRVSCVVGVYPAERERVQPLVVHIALAFDMRPAADGAGLDHSVDYARLSGETRFILQSGKFLLIETAAEAICRHILAPAAPDVPLPEIAAVTVRIDKPEAVEGVLASVEVTRRKGEHAFETLEHPQHGTVDVIYRAPECGIYRRRLDPGAVQKPLATRALIHRCMALSDGLLLQGEAVAPGAAYTFGAGEAYRWANPTDAERSVLCIDVERFDLDDAVVDDEAELTLPKVDHCYPEGYRQAYGR